MNLGNEVIVKNFHVLTGTHKVLTVSKDGKVYFKITKSDGTIPDKGSNQRVTTDQFCLESIKRIRLTKPTSCVFKKWEVTIPDLYSTASSGTDGIDDGTLLTVYMHFTNLFGYGITDNWEKYATIAKTSSMNTKCKIAYALAKQINNQYIEGHKPVQATAYNDTTALTSDNYSTESDGTKVYILIEDNTYPMQTPTRRRMERNMDPQPIEMYITTNLVTKKAAVSGHVDEDDWQWCNEVATKVADGKRYEGVADTAKTYKNAYLIWGLEKVSQLNSTETMADPCTGFIGYDSVMDGIIDSEMDASNGHNYWVLDIAYETLPKMGVPSGRNLKELSFAAATSKIASGQTHENAEVAPDALLNLLTAIGFTATAVWNTTPTPDEVTYTIAPSVSSSALDQHIEDIAQAYGDEHYKPLE